MTQQMTPGGCGPERLTQTQRQSPLGQTPSTWTRMRRRCSQRQERALPIPGQLTPHFLAHFKLDVILLGTY